MVELESEAFLLGIWKSYYEMEESLSLPELEEILRAQRDRREFDMKFMAGVNGINLDGEGPEEAEETDEDRKFKFDVVRERARAKVRGEDPDVAEMNMWGLDFVVEE